MAPELMAKDEYSFPADVFSFGITLMEILGGAYLELHGGDPGPAQDNPLGPGGWYIYKWLVLDERPVPVSISLSHGCPLAVPLISSMIAMDPVARPTMVDVCHALRTMFVRMSIPLDAAVDFWKRSKFGDFVSWPVFVQAACTEISSNFKKTKDDKVRDEFYNRMHVSFIRAHCLLTDGVALTEGRVVSIESFGMFIATFCNDTSKRWLESTMTHAAMVAELGCFIGMSSRSYAERILEPGTFLLRFSEREQGTIAVSYRQVSSPLRVGHPYIDHTCGGSYKLGKLTGTTIPQLVSKLQPVYGQPIKRVRPAIPSIASMFTPDQ
jgi:hypothetical protein